MCNKHKMKALLMSGPSQLNLGEVDAPVTKPGEIIVKTAYVGICGTDSHLYSGNSFYIEKGYIQYPFIFGHEYTGIVVAVGEGVKHPQIGARVVGHSMVPCLKCDRCQRGKRQQCRNLKEVGQRFMSGAAADYIAVPDYAVTVVPGNVSLKSATLTEPMVSAYSACARTQINMADRVAVIGSGTLGLMSLLVAKQTALTVDVIGLAESELQFALELGATHVLSPKKAQRNNYDVVIETSGTGSAMSLACDLADMGARLALFGLTSTPSKNVNQADIALKDLTVHGILHGIDCYGETLSLFARGKINPDRLVAQIAPPESAVMLFERMNEAGQTAPKFLIQFAGE